MASTYEMSLLVKEHLEKMEQQDPQLLEKPLDADPVKGPEAVSDLLTYLPEEQRKGALVGFVMAMLCD